MAFIRRVPTKSGATAVQIAEYAQGRQRIVKHLGSAHTEAELGVLLARARELLEDPAQGTLELDVEPAPVAASLVRPAPEPALFDTPAPASPKVRDAAGRVVGTDSRVLFEALAAVYAQLGFDVVGDEVFADLVIARWWSRPRCWTSRGCWATWAKRRRATRRWGAPWPARRNAGTATWSPGPASSTRSAPGTSR